MQGRRIFRAAKPEHIGGSGPGLVVSDLVEEMPVTSRPDLAKARVELAALEAELSYRGPERRGGPGAGLVRLLAAVLDEVDYGLLLIAADGEVVHANHAAHIELAATTSLQLVDRRLSGRNPADQRALEDALRAARAGHRTMLSISSGDPGAEVRTGLSIVPLPAALSRNHAGHAVLIALQRSRIAEALSVEAYARELGLSRREQQVLAALCDGLRVKEIASKLEIGEETVRSYVKHLKAKTGCANIVDMVNQVSRLPPMVPVRRDPSAVHLATTEDESKPRRPI